MNNVLNSLPNQYQYLKDSDAIYDQAEKQKDVTRVMNVAAKYGCLPLLEKGIERGHSLNPRNSIGPLYFALTEGKTDVADYLKKNGASMHHMYKDRCLLSHAAENGHAVAVKYLLESDVPVQGFHSYSPLHWATKNRHRKVVDLLLHHRANPNQSGSKGKYTPKSVPLAIALCNHDYDVILSLLRGGANPKGKGCYVTWEMGEDIRGLIREYKDKK